ncbi:alpha/beta hydrolase [Rhodocytophaga aerolata]|uniref:Alpha/beta hydrolase n=1 Tax=Rhodocytophaga aerolata TaxID=455078 RepID=A0ABT8RJF4_9BACT|nr:alpha/beta hydrolase [Rhodocytophaga aerolata]MDO1451373.1 alpha/beta hydrolase [Rhodocytophaga aerolata]
MNQYSTENLIKKIPGFISSFQKVNNLTLHYVIGGSGEPLLLLPGWPQTWWSYRYIMPLLAEKHTVIVVDLRGMGDSDKPVEGYTKKHMASDIKELVAALGYEKVNVAGHDMGGNVAYAFAANYPEKVKKLILLDTPPPDENMYRLPMLPVGAPVYPWWVAFNQVNDLPAQLLEGRFGLLLDHLLDKLLVTQEAINAFDRSVYIHHYNDKESIRASNAWYQAFCQDISDQKSYSKIENVTKGIASPASFGILENFLSGHVLKYEMKEIEGSGHFIQEEKPEETAKAILDFLK